MLIELQGVEITHGDATILTDVDFKVDSSELVYIIGKVGSGKSSLIRSLYAELPLKRKLGAKARILDYDLTRIKRKQVQSLQRESGIVFQDFKLLSDYTVGENLDFVLRATGWKRKAERRQRIEEVLERVELTEKKDFYPFELSGGEQQRIAIARALLNDPQIILADEPTGNLDAKTGHKIVGILRAICERGTAVVMITHNLGLLQQFPGIVYRCENGRMAEATPEYNTPIDLEEEGTIENAQESMPEQTDTNETTATAEGVVTHIYNIESE